MDVVGVEPGVGRGRGVQGAPIIRCGSRAVPLIEHMPTTW